MNIELFKMLKVMSSRFLNNFLVQKAFHMIDINRNSLHLKKIFHFLREAFTNTSKRLKITFSMILHSSDDEIISQEKELLSLAYLNGNS